MKDTSGKNGRDDSERYSGTEKWKGVEGEGDIHKMTPRAPGILP